MKSEHQVFAEIITLLDNLKIPYMIGGSVAAIAYGEPRLTLDMDVIVNLNPQQAKALSETLGPEYYSNLGSMQEAISYRSHFNIIHSEVGVKVDFYVLGNDEFSLGEFKRRRTEAFDENITAIFATPEDTIVKKLEWFKAGESQKHLDDIKGILKISGSILDLKYIDKWSLKKGLEDIWQKIRNDLQV